MTRSSARQKRRLVRSRLPALAAVAAAVALVAGGVATAQQAPVRAEANRAVDAGVATGITTPSTTIKLGFDVRGVVDKVDVKDNDKVKAGQPLLNLLANEQEATLKSLRLRADSRLKVAAAEQTYNVKKIDYEKKKSLYENKEARGTASQFEVLTAEAEMNIARIQIDDAKHEGDVAAAEAEAQQARLEKMAKVSPIDGEIRTVIVKPGEQVDETKPVVEIVDLDPLYVEVTLVDTAVVQKLKLGDKLRVKYGDESQWREATVDKIDPVADVRSGKHPFRLNLPNPEQRTAGLRVEVQLPAAMAGTN